jgi:kinetochore protein Spc24, fungi type
VRYFSFPFESSPRISSGTKFSRSGTICSKASCGFGPLLTNLKPLPSSAPAELSRTQAQLSSQYSDALAAHSSTSHANTILELDTQKFRIAKAVSDLEIEGERLSAELTSLKRRLNELEQQGPEGGDGEGRDAATHRQVQDASALKLRLYRDLGAEVETGRQDGTLGRVVVRSRTGGKDGRGDVHVVNIDEKNSVFFYANYFWDVL